MDPVALLTRMVEIPSLSGEESALAGFLVETMRGLGFQAHVDEAGNAVGTLGDGPTEIVLLGHLDTVPGAIPVRVEDGNLYGRGSVDAKGPLATFIAAAADVGALPGKRIVVVGATEEEAASSKGARHVARTRRPAFCVIGEPSATRAVTLGYKGRLVFAYQAETGASHSASPEENVIETAVAFWNGVRRWAEAENVGKKMFDALDPVLREVHSGSDGLTESMQLRASIRIPLGQTPETVQTRIEALAPTRRPPPLLGRRSALPSREEHAAGPGVPGRDSRRRSGAGVQGQERNLGHERGGPRLALSHRGVRPGGFQSRPHARTSTSTSRSTAKPLPS